MVRSKIDFSKIINRKLELSDDLSDFSCNIDDELGCDEFIHEEAMLYQKERYGITYLFFYEGVVIGYVTLAMSSMPARKLEEQYKDVDIANFPSLLIGQLGVNNDYRRSGIGAHICKWCVGVALDHSEDIGCRYVILVTTKGDRETFYTKCQFQKAIESKDNRENKIWMFLKTDIKIL